ncbi:hypothetical protein HETIRDRAFT_421727 [Heterobasidion irregulare TC 32-1]|uniref:FAD-binding PCMH-type domain-containing protein n=1 Tax=Heterobasidion irregulare (strain TC 32-1) TaxID=747525 RepID=W4JX03_HETIT|nr:uncharacterized protein HETIRDRAFT_421727 [Heterobasidion irregulare TC 32-1]ETW77615.1 hypothetical protein HETIRDRAFT_421727 [Heterobasidion irregulare TC 32-1]
MIRFSAISTLLFGRYALATGIPRSQTLALEVLSTQVQGRLYEGEPYSKPCFEDFDSAECESLRAGNANDTFRAEFFGSYTNTNWEACEAIAGDQCLLDWTNINSSVPTLAPNACRAGSISPYYIDVRRPQDVSAAFNFSKVTKTPLIIKNTGHDYKGRSSAPNTLALWTHNLQNITYNPNFVADGCSQANPGVTFGAGVQWEEAYVFAEAHNITLVGGSDRGVGVSGGWVQGGGHSALSNTMGLGVDRVLQFRLVTPDGKYVTANECQNEDLFFALRGGGGGTFGVVLESTMLASPRVTLQAVIISWANPNITLTTTLWTLLIDHAITWADQGWGGFVNGESVIYVSPTLNKTAATEAMKPLIEFGQNVTNAGVTGASVVVAEFPSYYSFFQAFANVKSSTVGDNLALGSRLVPRNNFATNTSKAELLDALLNAHAIAPSLRMLISPPTSFPGDNTTSVTEAWRDSIYHVTLIQTWYWNSTVDFKKHAYANLTKAIDYVRQITPDAAYQNEADIHEPNHEVSFWGTHYSRLLSIKKKYDPDHLLDCWHCVGWNSSSPRFACYL